MNTNHLKQFAQEARRKLIEQVGAKLSFVLTTDSAELREKTEHLNQLREELSRTTKEQLIEKVAYTWFNRLMALRFMDVNDYQPLGIRIVTPKDGYTIPELLDEAKRGNIHDELKINRQKVFDLLDNKIPSTNPQNEAFKELLIGACNHLNMTFPFLFERINDYTELLLPDDLTSDFSIVKDVSEGMLIDDCKNVEIIGWLYQFYISEEKERLINAKKKYKEHEIAPVTQLFTPKWIVKYMVDNTLGQYWKEARPNTTILKELEFYIKPTNETLIPRRKIKSPEEITFFDPCVGSAHVLCYAFDILYKIYEEEGYSGSDISELIVTKNLFGIDIDERAAQLAGFALMMKGLQYNRRFLKKGIIPHITAFKNIDSHPKFKIAQTLGSLIKISRDEFDEIIIEDNSIFSEQQKQLKKQAYFLANTYDIIVTNPPYLNSSYMEGELKKYVETEYKSTKSDLFSCFLIQACNLTKNDGLIGFISPYVWMFISSYEKLRKYIIHNTTISSLIQLEYNAFEPACVPIASFTLRNSLIEEYIGNYIKLSEFKGHETQAPKTLEAIRNPKCGWFFNTCQRNFEDMPMNIFGYWLTYNLIKSFSQNKPIKKFADFKHGMSTSDNQRFLRFWFEVEISKTDFKALSKDETYGYKKWFPYQKGGEYRKWYGNNYYLVNWHKDGDEIKNISNIKYPYLKGNLDFVIGGQKYFFKDGYSWSSLSSSDIGVRKIGIGFLFDAKGQCFFSKNLQEGDLFLALLNSSVAKEMLSALSPTLDFNSGVISLIPNIFENISSPVKEEILSLITNVYDISKIDWDMNETSWDFKYNKLLLIKRKEEIDVEEVLDLFSKQLENMFFRMHRFEEELNQKLINIMDLKDDVKNTVPYEKVSILKDISEIDNSTLLVNPKIVFAQFISYSIGCMFGRYSLDKEGLLLASQRESLEDYLQKIEKTKSECTFLPDDDNIIPILEDEWFEDDIVGRFYQFLKVTFGERNFNKNLAFIEEQIGKDIRKYFIKDFYPDHIKRYKKRPIYWMFSSPKGSFNVLVYMHRYSQDTVNNILNKYLKEFIGKLNTRKEHLQHVQVTGSASDKTKAIKEIDNIDKMLVELHEYERDVLYPLATERIEIDLDEGVLVNYNKFGKAVKEVSGLNDPKTKKKVKQFDWIDTTQIR